MSELEKLYARFLRRLPAKGKAADHYDDKARKVVIESRLVLFIGYLFLELSLIQGSIISTPNPHPGSTFKSSYVRRKIKVKCMWFIWVVVYGSSGSLI